MSPSIQHEYQYPYSDWQKTMHGNKRCRSIDAMPPLARLAGTRDGVPNAPRVRKAQCERKTHPRTNLNVLETEIQDAPITWKIVLVLVLVKDTQSHNRHESPERPQQLPLTATTFK